MTASRVILLRHGITDWNDSGRFQGQADIPLNDMGRQQAAAAAGALRSAGITQVLCSDLSRARETAAIVTAGSSLRPVVDPKLQEVNVGSWSGLTMAEVGNLEPDFWPALQEGRDFRRSAEGETATQAGQRVALAVLDRAEELASGEVLLVVGHGLSLRVGALLLMGLDYSYARLFHGLVNCHWISLRPGGDAWKLEQYNASASGPIG